MNIFRGEMERISKKIGRMDYKQREVWEMGIDETLATLFCPDGCLGVWKEVEL